MGLPFTAEQFFQIFATYNGRFSLVVAVWWLASLGIVAAAWRNPARRGRLVTYFLAVLWMWNAVAYHAILFTRINPAAWLFAALFALQAALLVWAGTRRSLQYFSSRGPTFAVGFGLVVYSFLYPFLSALSHAYPATPTFAVPCPTTIMTIGLLLTVHDGVPSGLAIIPILWALIGGSASVILGVPTDYVLLAAAPLWIGMLVAQRMHAIAIPIR
jgi:hypothetical protein